MRKTKTTHVTKLLSVVMMLVLSLGLSMVAFATAKDGDTVRVKGETANVRSDAGTTYAVVCEVSNTTDLKVTGSKQGTDGYTWYAISFEQGGESKSGYIRSDLVTITASGAVETTEEPPVEETTEPENTGSAGSDYSFSTINPMMTDEMPDAIPAGFNEVLISANGQETKAWTDGDFFLMYATSPTGTVGWYIWDKVENTYMRYASFMKPVAVSENEVGSDIPVATKDGIAKPVFFIFVGITVVLIGVTAVMGFKLLNRGSSYDDDDDDDEEDDDEDEDDEEEERPRRRSVFAPKRRGSRYDDDDEDDDDDDEDEDEDEDDDEDDEVPAPQPKKATASSLPAGAKVVGHTSDGREIIRMADGRQVVRASSAQTGQKIIGRTADGRDIIQLPDGRKVVRTPRVKKADD